LLLVSILSQISKGFELLFLIFFSNQLKLIYPKNK
jgi:hypothetical protein